MKIPSLAKLPIALIWLLAVTFGVPVGAHAAQTILVFGDSLSAGYGLAVEDSWAHLLQQELARTHPSYRVVNASISGETTLGGRERIRAALQQHRPAIVILELGANDGLRGFSIASIETNLAYMIRTCQRARAKVLLVGMKLPPNYGAPYTTGFDNLYPTLARKYHVRLLPFLLAGVAPEQFQPDNLHPTKDAQPLLLDNVLQALRPLLGKNDEKPSR